MKKKLFTFSLLLSAMILFVSSCKKTETEVVTEAYYRFGDEIAFTSAEQSKTILLKIDSEQWQVASAGESWCSAVKTDGKLTISVGKNDEPQARSATIIINDGVFFEETITIVQDIRRYIDVENLVSVASGGESKTVEVKSNLENGLYVSVTDMTGGWLDAKITDEGLALTARPQGQGETEREAAVKVFGVSALGEEVSAELTVIQTGDGTLEFYFDIPDFSDSWVYKVMKGGVQIGEICKEFITPPGLQAVVVYPVENGVTDLKNGYVAQVLMQRVPAPVIGDTEYYPAPTDPVHGGSVGFDTQANAVDVDHPYVEGTLADPVTRVYMNGAGSFSHEGGQFATRAYVIPYTVRDQRGSEREYVYPVVKIAAQYWLKENLKTTRNRDGSYIATNLQGQAQWGAAYNADPRNAKPQCAVYGLFDANSFEALTMLERVGVSYTSPCLDNRDFRDETGEIIIEVDADNNLTGDNLSPEGWQIPAEADFKTLLLYAGSHSNDDIRRVREILDDDGNIDNLSGKDDENITGFSGRSMGYRLQSSGNWSTTKFYYWTRTYSPEVTSGNTYPAMWAINGAGFWEQCMMRSFSVRCLRK